MTRTAKPNLERLKNLLELCPRSQKEMASRIGVDEGTLSRWKRGEKVPRANHLAKLANELGTTVTELCSDGPPLKSPKSPQASDRGQVAMMLDTGCRNALALVARRYGVTRQQIVEAAPLLFLIIAEQSLQRRQEELEAVTLKLGEIESSTPQHLRKWLRASVDLEDQELLEAEKRSIQERDLFANRVGPWDDNHAKCNPFARFLDEKLKSTKLEPEKTVSWDGSEPPNYRIGVQELFELLGKNVEAIELVLEGKVALAEMPRDVRCTTQEKRATWITERAGLNRKEGIDALEKIDLADFRKKISDPADIKKGLYEAIEQKKYDF